MKKVFLGSGIVAALFGALYYFLPGLLEMGIRSQINVKEDGQLFPNWIKFPVAIKNEFRFFEIVNPEKALRGSKIEVRERGPYCLK